MVLMSRVKSQLSVVQMRSLLACFHPLKNKKIVVFLSTGLMTASSNFKATIHNHSSPPVRTSKTIRYPAKDDIIKKMIY